MTALRPNNTNCDTILSQCWASAARRWPNINTIWGQYFISAGNHNDFSIIASSKQNTLNQREVNVFDADPALRYRLVFTE